MDSHTLFYIIITILLVQYLIEVVLEYVNARRYDDPLPKELDDLFSAEEDEKSRNYKKTRYIFGLVSNTFSVMLTLGFLIFGGFQMIDVLVRGMTDNAILMALLFFGIIMIGTDIITTPLAYYSTFVIEQKFGFNKTTPRLFFVDKLKGWIMSAILGGGMLAAIMWFYQWAGPEFWLYAWGMVVVFTVFMNLFYSKLIVPLFNKQTPLETGSLKSKIEGYAHKVGFELQNIFVLDGSKRSTKANAYFTGFGKQKRVTLYDTLLHDLEDDEIVAVLAHEVGHYKRKHIVFNLMATILMTGLTLYILSLFINNPEVSLAIGVTTPSFHAALIGFGILYSPISEITGLLMNYLSRKFEYEADDYAKKTFAAQPLITSLKKLSKNSLSNLTPHPAYVFVHYSHPPLIARIRNLRA
ncbi:MAG: M48 family metallopeptidase [Maribacter sp.]|nr:M48 family metallopeptidase [Maribacter sp.]